MITRQFYIIIARIIKDSDTREELINKFSNWFKNDNPRFSHDRFRKACLTEIQKDKFSADFKKIKD